MAKKTPKQKPYTVTLTIDKDVFETQGDTLLEAINALPQLTVTYKGLLKVQNGARSLEKMFYVFPLRKFIHNPLTRQIWAKHFEGALK